MAPSPMPEELEPGREYQLGQARPINPEWNLAAAQVGSTLGHAVNRMREAPQRVQQAARQIGSELRGQLELIRDPNAIAHLQQQAEQTLDELEYRAREEAQVVRNRAELIARRNPVAIVVADFAIAFTLGIVLRVRRSGRG